MIKDDVELLDLCILAYQLHSQTLLCAPDPYGEQMQQTGRAHGARRYRFLNALEEVLRDQNHPRAQAFAGTHGYDGAGQVGAEVRVAPIPCKYDRISPRFPGYVRPNRDTGGERWIKYLAPQAIRDRIGHWETWAYPANTYPPAGAPVRVASALSPAQPPPGSPDRLYCFEGATGDSPSTNTGILCLMGFVLARAHPNPPANPPIRHDLVIAFRGSRSGGAGPGRVGRIMMSQIDPNPDWKTNLDNEFVQQQNAISTVGRIHRGFAVAVEKMLPTIRACVDKAHQDMGESPRSVYVTGHSLGGALATCFASAVVLGNNPQFGPDAGKLQPTARSAWRNLRLVTFGAPAVGGPGGTLARIFNSAVGARAYRIREDPVPRNAKGTLSGHDIILPGAEVLGPAHNPKYIRRHLQEHLSPWRNQDQEDPWIEGNNIGTIVADFQGLANRVNSPYRFGDGLILYLSAFAEMGKRDMTDTRLTDPEKDIIDKFIDRVAPNALAVPQPIDWAHPDQLGTPTYLRLHFNPLGNIHQIAAQGGMLSMLKHWLALMTVQNGGAIQQQAHAWFGL
jgi:Lipase (class 3)